MEGTGRLLKFDEFSTFDPRKRGQKFCASSADFAIVTTDANFVRFHVRIQFLYRIKVKTIMV